MSLEMESRLQKSDRVRQEGGGTSVKRKQRIFMAKETKESPQNPELLPVVHLLMHGTKPVFTFYLDL